MGNPGEPTFGENLVPQQPPHGEDNPKYKNMRANMPSRPRNEGDDNRGMSDKDYKAPDTHANDYYGPTTVSSDMQNSLRRQDEIANELKGIPATTLHESPDEQAAQKDQKDESLIAKLQGKLRGLQEENAQRHEEELKDNPDNLPRFLAEAQKRRAELEKEMEKPFVEESTTAEVPATPTGEPVAPVVEPLTPPIDLHQQALDRNQEANRGISTNTPLSENGQNFFKDQNLYDLPIDEQMTPDQKARYENYFNQERPKTGDEMYRDAILGQFEARADDLEDQRKDTSTEDSSKPDLLEEVRKNIANANKQPSGLVQTSPQVPPAVEPGPPLSEPEVTPASTDSQTELLKAQTELIAAVKELTKALEDLKKAFPNDPQVQIIANNILVGTGNIINNNAQNNINSNGNVLNVTEGEGRTPTTAVETPSVSTPGETPAAAPKTDLGEAKAETKKEGGEKKINVDELENLNNQKKNLEKKLEDPNLTPDEKEKAQKALDELNIVIEKTEKLVQEDQKEAAKKVTELTPEDQKELEDAGKTKEGFLATITRAFKGKKWQTWVAQAGLSTASTLLVGKVAAATVALGGPIGAGIVGAGVAVMGGIAAVKTIRNIKKVADSQGKSVKELAMDKRFLTGAILGSAFSGVTRLGLPALVPGSGMIMPVLGMATEITATALGDRYQNKEQEKLVNSLLNSYEARRYTKLKEQGYVSREGVNLERIVADMTDKNLSEDERKTARKAAVASLRYLYEKTQDDKYKTLHYTVKENGVDVRKELDITAIGTVDAKGSTSEYPMLELKGINFEAVGDLLDLDELKTLTLEASNHSALGDKKAMTNDLVSLFAGLEAADVDSLLSAEREKYFQTVSFLAGFRTGTGVVNSLIVIKSGVEMTAQAVQAHNQSADASRAVEDKYRKDLNDSDAEVKTYTRADGSKVDAIDLDHDGTNDLIHDVASDHYIANSPSGAEKLFEIQHPEMGDVHFSEFASNTTGITGTIVGADGAVVGVMYHDAAGNIGVMSSQQLTETLGATYTTGTTAEFSMGSIQPDGSMTLNIGGHDYSTSLTDLHGIPAVEGVDSTLEGDPFVGIVQPGDSVPSVLTKIMQVAQEHNPALREYDPYQLQRELYQGNRLANDSAIRSEFGFTNPVRPDQEYNIRNSPTVLGWLEKLNGGPINMPGASGHAGIPGSDGINFGFNAPAVEGISMEGLSAEEIAGPTVGSLAALGASAIGAFAPTQIGGIVRSTEVKVASSEGETPEPKPVVVPTPPITPETEKEYISKVLETQVFTYTKEGKIKVTSSITFDMGGKKLQSTDNGWMLDGELVGPEEVTKITAVFLTLERNEQAKVLTQVLEKMTPDRRVELGNAVEFKKYRNGTWVEFTKIKTTEKETLDNATLADRILLIKRNEKKEVVGSVLPPAPKNADGTPKTEEQINAEATAVAGSADKTEKNQEETKKEDGTGEVEASTTVETTTAEGEATEAKEKEKKDEFNTVINKIITLLQRRDTQISVNKRDYHRDASTKLWFLDGDKKGAPAQFTGDQVLAAYNANRPGVKKGNVKDLESDVTTMLNRLQQDGTEAGKRADKITVGTTSYTRRKGSTGELIWEGKDKENKENNKVFTDKELASKIVNISRLEASAQASTEQADSTEKKKEAEKPERKSRALLRGALLATGIVAGGASGLFGGQIAGAVVIGAAVVGTGSGIVRFFSERRMRKLTQESEALTSSVANRDDKQFTTEEVAKRKELEKKIESARKVTEVCKDIAWFTTPLAIASGVSAMLSPEIAKAGLQIDIKAWLEGTINRIKLNPQTVTEPFKFGRP